MNRPHRGLKGICPAEILVAGRGPGIDESVLQFLMMSMEMKTVGRNGVTLPGQGHYYNESLYGLKERVMVRYDMEDLSRVYIYDKTGTRFICEAEAVKKVHPVARILGTADDLKAVQDGISLKRHLEKTTTESARVFVENAPALLPVPDRRGIEGALAVVPKKKEKKDLPLPRAEAEFIEAEAAKMKVVHLTPKVAEAPVWASEMDRYEALLEIDCKNADSLSIDDMAWMRYYEKTKEYKGFKDRFEFLRELYIAGPEEAEGTTNNTN